MSIAAMFEMCSGSVIGREHRETGKNNQDALATCVSDDAIIAVVCDGCSSSPHSEIGATLGARITLQAVWAELVDTFGTPESGLLDDTAWDRAVSVTLAGLDGLVRAVPWASYPQWWRTLTEDCLLFTIVGFLVTRKETTVFAIGDGVALVNGEEFRFGPFPGNAPPYLAHALQNVSASDVRPAPVLLRFPTENVRSVLIGTDGVVNLLQKADTPMPGRAERVGPISQFWADDRYFANPDMVRRKLTLVNRDVVRANWQKQRTETFRGLLPDDTTLIVLRKKEAGKEEGT